MINQVTSLSSLSQPNYVALQVTDLLSTGDPLEPNRTPPSLTFCIMYLLISYRKRTTKEGNDHGDSDLYFSVST